MKKNILLYFLLSISLAFNGYFVFESQIMSWFADLQVKTVQLEEPQSKLAEMKPRQIAAPEDEQVIPDLSVFEQVKQALLDGDYIQATHLLGGASEAEVISIRRLWLSHAESLINNQDYLAAQQALMNYLDFSSEEADFHYLMLQVLQAQEFFDEAIKYAYNIQYYLYEPIQRDKSILQARKLAQNEIDKLLAFKNWEQLSLFLNELISLDPEYLLFYWRAAQAEFEQGAYELAIDNLQPLFDSANFNVRARKLEKQILALQQAAFEVPLQKQGEHYIVSGLINDDVNVNLLIDTGASISLLSYETFNNIAQQQALTYIKSIQVNTAGGNVTADLYQVPVFAIDEFAVENMLFAVSRYYESDNDGLLGMNYLRRFKFSLNQNTHTLSLENK